MVEELTGDERRLVQAYRLATDNLRQAFDTLTEAIITQPDKQRKSQQNDNGIIRIDFDRSSRK